MTDQIGDEAHVPRSSSDDIFIGFLIAFTVIFGFSTVIIFIIDTIFWLKYGIHNWSTLPSIMFQVNLIDYSTYLKPTEWIGVNKIINLPIVIFTSLISIVSGYLWSLVCE